MAYTQLLPTESKKGPTPPIPSRVGDAPVPENYIPSKQALLAIDVALATGRPLLVQGPPGAGKSSLASYAANQLSWPLRTYVVSSRTESRDLLWTYDALERLNDAQANQLKEPADYVRPGVLFWAFAPTQAAELTGVKAGKQATRSVVLIDEIDKADSDIPNGLLVALGSMRFTIAETKDEITGNNPPLVFITSNDERRLPSAFIRRCIRLELTSPEGNELIKIGNRHFPEVSHALLTAIARQLDAHAKATPREERKPSTAEFLDAIQACVALHLDESDADFQEVTGVALNKLRGGTSR